MPRKVRNNEIKIEIDEIKKWKDKVKQNKYKYHLKTLKLEPLKTLKPEENQELEKIEGISPKKIRNDNVKIEIDAIKKCEEKIERNKYKYCFQQYER